jgi:HK97 family phage major capsid protein
MDIKQMEAALEKGIAPVLAKIEEQGNRLAALEKGKATVNAAGIGETTPRGASHLSKAARVRKQVKLYSEGDVHKGKALAIGAFMRALAHSSKGHFRETPEAVLGRWGYEEEAELAKAALADVDVQLRAMGEATVSAGGALIVPEWASEVIELLRATAVIRSLGPTMVPMMNGAVSIRKQTGASTASYVGESSPGTPSAPTVGFVSLIAKKLIAIIVSSNELLNDASPEADAMVRNDLVTQLQLREDLAFIRGDGTSNTPKGLRYLANASNINAATQAGSTATLSEVIADLNVAMGGLADNNVALDQTCAWLMSPRSKRYLGQLRDGVGGFVFKAELDQGKLMGYRVAESTQIPNTLGTGHDSEVTFVKMSEALLGDTKTLELTFHPDGAYDNGSVVKSGISQDESAFRAIARHDFGVRHDYAVSVLTTVKWGY